MATKTQRPRPDVFTDPKVYGDAIADAIHHALLPLDRAASKMELKWGCERLPSLVSPATAALFGSAKAKLDAAIQANDPQEVESFQGVRIYSLDEIGRILDHDSLRLVNAAKNVFPGAKIKKIRKTGSSKTKIDDPGLFG